MKFTTIIQARQDSKRFPGKILKKYKNTTFLELLIKRLQKSKSIKKIIVATSTNPLDKEIKKVCQKLNIYCFQGSELDVIDRYYQASKLYILEKFFKTLVITLKSNGSSKVNLREE